MHILFVDDTFEIRDLYRLAFSLGGHTTETAHNGMEALRIIEQHAGTLDVIFLDYNMPGLTGTEVVRELRKREDIPRIPIILFTGVANGVLDDEARELEIARVVYKPFLPHELLKVAVEVTGGT